MKTQFVFLLVMLCLNVSLVIVGYASSQGTTLIAGMDNISALNGTGSADDYTGVLNATEIMDEWRSEGTGSTFILGDVFTGVNQFFTVFRFLIDGVPYFFDLIGSTLPVGAEAFGWIAMGIRILTAAMLSTLIIEFISGRELLP